MSEEKFEKTTLAVSFQEEPTGNLRFETFAYTTTAPPTLMQEFRITKFLGGELYSMHTDWRPVPTVVVQR